MSQGTVLKYMEEHKEATVKEISEGLGISTTTIGGNLKMLKSEGYLVNKRLKKGKYWILKWFLVD